MTVTTDPYDVGANLDRLRANAVARRRAAVLDRVSLGTRLDEYLLELPKDLPDAPLATLNLRRVSSGKAVHLLVYRVGAGAVWTGAPHARRAVPSYGAIQSVQRLAELYAACAPLRVDLHYVRSGYHWVNRMHQGLPRMPWRAEDLFADLEVLSPLDVQ